MTAGRVAALAVALTAAAPAVAGDPPAAPSPATAPRTARPSSPAHTEAEPEPAAVREAGRLFDAGRYADAAERLEAQLARQPQSGERAYALLAAARLELGLGPAALDASERGLALYPSSARLQGLDAHLIGQVLPAGERESRLEARVAAGTAGPGHLRALAQIRIDREPRDPRAVELLGRAVADAPADAPARFLYGESLCLTRQEARCIEELERAMALAPGNDAARFQALTLIAHARDRLNQEKEAEAAYEQAWTTAERLPAPNPVGLFRYVEFLVIRNRNEEAERRVDRILERAPAFAPARFEKARQLSRRGDLRGAVAAAERALAAAPDDVLEQRPIHVFLARTLYALGDEPRAREHQAWVEQHR